MKKFVVLSLIALLVLAFGTTAFAQAKKEEPKLEFKASGFIDTRLMLHRNISLGTGNIYTFWDAPYLPDKPGVAAANKGAWDRTVSIWDQRGRLKFDAIMGKTLSGTFFFEIDSISWGEQPDGTRNTAGRWDADRAALEVKNLYLDFAVPGIPIPVSMRIGIQPHAIRPHILTYSDGPGITAGIMVDPVRIGLQYFKAFEGKGATADDIDVYALTANAKVGALTVGGYGLYWNANTYPIRGAGPLAYGVSDTYSADMWWLGVHADGKMGPVMLNFDFVYNTGEVDRRVNTAALKDIKYRGFATKLKLDFPWEKFNFGGTFMYATGADMRKARADGLSGNTPYGANFPAKKVGSYVVPPASAQCGIAQDSLIMYGTWSPNIGMWPTAGNNYANFTRGGYGGTWFAKASASFKATPWYKVTVDALYIGDTTKKGNTLGNAVKANGLPKDDSTIGWELNLINDIQIYKNLNWKIGLGMLFASDALDQWSGVGVVNGSPKNPWLIESQIVYSF